MNNTRNGFSLVELSIVLVILGLLVGGILAGKSLIHASELRSVSTERSKYLTAIHAFKDKYLGLPGDITNASSFWSGAGNGNGDGSVGITTGIGTYAANGTQGEWYKAWDHLAKAGLMEGTYTGVSGGAHVYNDAVKGDNIPYAKYPQAGWCFENGSDHQFTLDYHNSLVISGAASGGTYCRGLIFLGEDVWNIDTKLDDGMPAQGKVVSTRSASCTTAGTTYTDYAATYNLANYCSIAFIRSF